MPARLHNLRKITTFVSIGSQIKFLCDYAFAHCERLTTIYCLADTPPQKSWSVFYDSYAIERIYVPYNSVNTYKRIWQTYASKIYPYKNGGISKLLINYYLL